MEHFYIGSDEEVTEGSGSEARCCVTRTGRIALGTQRRRRRTRVVRKIGAMLVTAAAAVVGYAAAADTVATPVHHIVEEPGAIERLTEIETPTEYYYQKLRSDLG